MNNCLNIIPQSIIVIGDIMLDILINGTIYKIANEAPVPVLHQDTERKTLGGCGNVLMNLFELGCNKLYIISMIGDDLHGKHIQNILYKHIFILFDFIRVLFLIGLVILNFLNLLLFHFLL